MVRKNIKKLMASSGVVFALLFAGCGEKHCSEHLSQEKCEGKNGKGEQVCTWTGKACVDQSTLNQGGNNQGGNNIVANNKNKVTNNLDNMTNPINRPHNMTNPTNTAAVPDAKTCAEIEDNKLCTGACKLVNNKCIDDVTTQTDNCKGKPFNSCLELAKTKRCQWSMGGCYEPAALGSCRIKVKELCGNGTAPCAGFYNDGTNNLCENVTVAGTGNGSCNLNQDICSLFTNAAPANVKLAIAGNPASGIGVAAAANAICGANQTVTVEAATECETQIAASIADGVAADTQALRQHLCQTALTVVGAEDEGGRRPLAANKLRNTAEATTSPGGVSLTIGLRAAGARVNTAGWCVWSPPKDEQKCRVNADAVAVSKVCNKTTKADCNAVKLNAKQACEWVK